MAQLISIIAPIALVDSTSMIPFTLLAMSVLASTERPILGYMMFACGVFVAYFAFGFLVLMGLGAIFEQLNAVMTQFWKNPQTPDMIAQMIIGAVLVFFGVRLANKRKQKGEQRLPEEGMSPGKAFVIGVVVTVIGMPGALPFFAAADQILRADLSLAGNATALLGYVLVFVAPMFVLLAIRLSMGDAADRIFGAIDRVFDSWGRRIIIVLLVGLGALLLVDAIGWFLGHPLIPVP
jgi:threonine/homoserine/homoserine lactone efflux protein